MIRTALARNRATRNLKIFRSSDYRIKWRECNADRIKL